MISKADEKRAQRLVLANVNAALGEMREYVLRELAAGRKPDTRMMQAMVAGLNNLAEEYSLDLMSGPYGGMIADAMKTATAEVAGISGTLVLVADRATIEAALFKSGWQIKGILDEGQRIVSEELLRSIVGGRSRAELADAISERLRVRDEDGEMGDIPRWRAELIARNELMSNYRSTSLAAAKDAGFKQFKMAGPDDDRTSAVCERHIGEVHTEEEWEAIGEDEGVDPAYPIMSHGFHINCRHRWLPVAESLEAEA